MEHVSSVHPTGKFPEKVENLKRWSRFPGWNFRTGMSCSIYVPRSLYQFQVHRRAPRRNGVYDQVEQLFTNGKFHFCSHRNFRFFCLNGKRPFLPIFRKARPSVFRVFLVLKCPKEKDQNCLLVNICVTVQIVREALFKYCNALMVD